MGLYNSLYTTLGGYYVMKHVQPFWDTGASAVGVCRACSGTVGEEEEEKRKNIEI